MVTRAKNGLFLCYFVIICIDSIIETVIRTHENRKLVFLRIVNEL